MAKNISLLGANYPDVPAVQLPQRGGGTATFYDVQVIDNLNSSSTTDALSANQGKVLNGKIANIGITSHGRTTFAWGASLDITRETNKGAIIMCGRNGNGNMIYVIPNTNEFVNWADANHSALASVNITSTKITLTSNSTGYGSNLTVEIFWL